MHGEEVARVVQLLDQFEFMRDTRLDVGRHAVRPARGRGLMHAVGERLQRRAAGFEDFVGVFVVQLIEREAGAGIEHADRAGQRLGVIAEQTRHLGRALEAAFAVAVGGMADPVDRGAEADGRQHVGEAAAGRMVIARVGQRAAPARKGATATAALQPLREFRVGE
jgi:hypothetical protein